MKMDRNELQNEKSSSQKKMINFHFQRAFESLDGSTPIPHMAVCIIATLILLPCIFLRDLKVNYSSYVVNSHIAQKDETY